MLVAERTFFGLDGGPWSTAGLKDSWSGLILTGSYPVSHGKEVFFLPLISLRGKTELRLVSYLWPATVVYRRTCVEANPFKIGHTAQLVVASTDCRMKPNSD